MSTTSTRTKVEVSSMSCSDMQAAPNRDSFFTNITQNNGLPFSSSMLLSVWKISIQLINFTVVVLNPRYSVFFFFFLFLFPFSFLFLFFFEWQLATTFGLWLHQLVFLSFGLVRMILFWSFVIRLFALLGVTLA